MAIVASFMSLQIDDKAVLHHLQKAEFIKELEIWVVQQLH